MSVRRIPAHFKVRSAGELNWVKNFNHYIESGPNTAEVIFLIPDLNCFVLLGDRGDFEQGHSSDERCSMPVRSSGSRRCITTMIAPVCLLSKRIGKLALYQILTCSRLLSESASIELKGSSIITISPPRPVSPPIDGFSEAKAIFCGDDLSLRVFDDPQVWKDTLIPRTFQDRAAVVVKFYCEI